MGVWRGFQAGGMTSTKSGSEKPWSTGGTESDSVCLEHPVWRWEKWTEMWLVS